MFYLFDKAKTFNYLKKNKKGMDFIMKIKINLQIFFFIIIFLLTRQIKIYGILMIFAFIHELGHMLAGIILGLKPSSMEIMPFGLRISFDVNPYNYNKKIINATMLTLKKLIIACMGPITNLILVIIYCIFDITFFGIQREFVIYANILIGAFNLIPIYPLDGGRIAKCLIHIFVGLKQSYKYTNLISNITIILLTSISSIAILYLKNIAILVIIIYLWILVLIENKRYRSKLNCFLT